LEGSADAAEPDAHNGAQPETLDAFPQSPCSGTASGDQLQSTVAGMAIPLAGTPSIKTKASRVTRRITRMF
jgi:hypothetical protein